jgi:hypothetical protein
MTCSQFFSLSRRRAVTLVVVTTLVTLTGISGTAQSQGQARGRTLFADGPEAAADGSDPTTRRGRRVRANAAALHDTSAADAGDVTLNLFEDVQLRARRTRLDVTPKGGTVWHGRLLDVQGDATIAVNDGVMAGTVFAGDRVYEILYAGNGEHDVREVQPSAFPTDDPDVELELTEPDDPGAASALDAAIEAGIAADSASQVDVMIVWTTAARTAAGGTAAIQSLVDLSVANANTAYANSGVTQRLRLVYAGEVSYSESGVQTDLSRLTNTSDGYMDSVHSLRNTYGADVVTLIGSGYASGGSCGVGYLMTYVWSGFAGNAFNVVDRTCSASNQTYAHEVGHNMGLQHDPNNAGTTPAYNYAFGYQHPTGAFRTVMAYPCPSGSCPRVKHFSNPNVTYNGMPTGSATSNNALALNNTAATVANFRQAVTGGTCSYSLASSSSSVGSGTSTGTVSVVSGSGCAWSASSGASWLTITSGASGTANGTVGYSVAANTASSSRTGTLTVAGKTFTVTQAAATCGGFTLSSTSKSMTSAGGSVSVTVTGTTGCARTATSNVSWITVTSGASGTGSGTVAFSVAANTAGTSRTGTLTIAGVTYTVTQSAASCSAFTLSSTSKSMTSTGGSVSVTVTGTTGCARTATSNVSWITVTSGASGTGSGTVAFSVAANTASTSRTGTLTIAGVTYTVTQSGTTTATTCTYAISPSSALIPSSGGSSSFALTTSSGCSATTITSASWLTVTSGATGSGSRTIAYTVAPNAGSSRTGTITVGGKTMTVGQLAKSSLSSADAAKSDFDGDQMADLLWQHTDGSVAVWMMAGVTAKATSFLSPGKVDPAWRMIGSGDLDGNGKPEIVWQHADGWLLAWFMNADSAVSAAYLNPNQVEPAWRIAAIADINNDSRADLVWQHETGMLAVWYMNGSAMTGSALLNPSSAGGNDWQIVGAGDVNADGKTDLIWQQQSGGLVGAWLMDGVNATSFTLMTPGAVDPAVWKLRGVIDIDADGKTDLLWQHSGGSLLAWLMDGTSARTAQALDPGGVAAGWRLVGPR